MGDDATVMVSPWSLTQPSKRSGSVAALAAALAKAQGEMAPASKDSLNPHYKARYASLAAVWDACRGPLTKNGLSVLQPVRADAAKVTVTTILAHSSGEWISEDLTVTAVQNTPQGIGSAITYGRRYGLSSMVGIAPDDDDGAAASIDEHDQRRPDRPTLDPGWAGDPRPELENELPPPAAKAKANGHGKDLAISEAQAKRFFAIAKGAGWRDEELKAWLKEVWQLESSRDIPRSKYDAICKAAEVGDPTEDPAHP